VAQIIDLGPVTGHRKRMLGPFCSGASAIDGIR
jgi:hypothetical protein